MILVLIDLFTGFVMLRVVKQDSAQYLARLLLEIFAVIGPGKIVESDNGPHLTGDVLRAFSELVGMNQRFITPYHPQSNGRVERMNQTVRHVIRKLLEGSSLDWPAVLPFVQLVINRKINRRTGVSPFELEFGREMNGFQDYTNDKLTAVEDMSINEWREYQEKLINVIYPACEVRSTQEEERYREQLDHSRRLLLLKKLPSNTKVLLIDPTYVKDTSIRPKYISMYLPSKYRVVACTNNGAYTVANDDTGEILDRKVTIDQMRRISGPAVVYQDGKDEVVPKKKTRQLEEFTVEKILGERMKRDRAQYLLKWKGYERPSWEWKTNVKASRLLREYEKDKRKGEIKPIDEQEVYESPPEDEGVNEGDEEENEDEGNENDSDARIAERTWKRRDRPALMKKIDEKIKESEAHWQARRQRQAREREERQRKRELEQ